MDTLNPVMPITSVVRYAIDTQRDANVVAGPLGTHARRVGVVDNGKPRVTIIVAGETARAQNFSLGGYAKMTNPELAKRNVVYFPNTSSCGTATATSIPCLFSVYTRAEYSHRKGLETENLLDVLTHAKVGVTWLDRRKDRDHYQPYYAISKDGGATFTGDQPLSDVLSDPHIVYDFGAFRTHTWAGNTLYATWTDTRTGIGQIFFGGVQF